MKLIVVVISLILSSCSMDTKAQTAQEFIKSCIEETKENGASSIIVKATLCSACRGESTYEGFILIKESPEIYKIRYLRYINRPASVKVLKDKIFTDDKIEGVFKIMETYHDSIFWQLSNIEGLLTDTIIENGRKMYTVVEPHGKLRYLGLYHNNKSASSFQSIIDLNAIFEKAYYYWLLNSSINNYIQDFLKLRIDCKD